MLPTFTFEKFNCLEEKEEAMTRKPAEASQKKQIS
jgi:hypothetical protein